ncbi:restriction endonuclease [Serratia marcescens]|uniref:restriction endonuclease n=1 Tax=Serratia marcescens TaxID=615 RepID=UPI001D54731A|nr:restriction endonuclease [Serratia marcescens]MBN5185528.1 restriction endonuclease [Serratia marcescens]MBN5193490.1 restriction endonuclease [Serratia marcescens]WVJ42471.1 restriction endonuclease [Serratia marcescens]BEO26271.1 restriction endonuclease [Serratia marcescens]
MIFSDLHLADLYIDEIYGGSRNGNASDDPLPQLLSVDNGAGFRHLGKRPSVETLKLLVLKTNFSDPSWPDMIDKENGTFIYYGDNRKPGDIHKTNRQGNLILKNLFDEAHSRKTSLHFPPIFIFSNSGVYRDVVFLGLAVPGAIGLSSDDDLTAIWRKSEEGNRFQNYRAIFTILDVPKVNRQWIKDIQLGNAVNSIYAPRPWLDWVKSRKLAPLRAQLSKKARTKAQQIPASNDLIAYINCIHSYYKNNPYGFEKCAIEIARFFMPNIHRWEITRQWRDGGRDAIGTYRLGLDAGSIDVEFALEAKCYKLNSGVGVQAVSRLISRLRHRQFGIIVTTSYVDKQAYEELINDNHPVVVISAIDIANKVKEKIGGIKELTIWLERI